MEQKVIVFWSELFQRDITLTVSEELNQLKGKVSESERKRLEKVNKALASMRGSDLFEKFIHRQ